MKRTVWINKSNSQLCVTIPKGSGIKEGDIVSVEKEKIKRIVYTPVVADLFHYGHLRLLEKANDLGDFHICGVLTDKAVKSYGKGVIVNLKERMAIISALRCVDMVVTQHDIDPTDNLKDIHNRFKDAKLILVYGSNWKKAPGSDFIKKIKGKIIYLPFYEKLSKENIFKKMSILYDENDKKRN